MPEKLNLQAGEIPDQPFLHRLIQESKGTAADARKRKANLSITLDAVTKVINKMAYDEDTEKGLIKIASACPQGALTQFMSSISVYVAGMQRERRGTKIVMTKSVISQKRQERLQEMEEAKLRAEQEKRRVKTSDIADFFVDDSPPQQAKVVPATEVTPPPPPPSPPPPKPEPKLPQPSREEIVEQMEMRRKFAQRLQEMNEEPADEEWLK